MAKKIMQGVKSTYCNVTKRQEPVLKGLLFSHYSAPGQQCFCDKLQKAGK